WCKNKPICTGRRPRACLPVVWGGRWKARCVSRTELLTDAQWELIAPLMPTSRGRRGRPFADHRTVMEGIIYRYRCGIAWRDVPVRCGPWQPVGKRLRRVSGGACPRCLDTLDPAAAGEAR